MPTIKIVPMPGVAVPGPQGPRGYQGDTGLPGINGTNANTGDIDFLESTITAHSDLTIGVDVVPGIINLSAYAGVNIQTHQDFGLYVNGISPQNKVLTQANLSGATGSFISQDNKMVTVANGIITLIEEIV